MKKELKLVKESLNLPAVKYPILKKLGW
jgi:hypothetical protein